MLLDVAFVALLTAWGAGVGLAVLRKLAPVPDHPTDALALAVPLGLGLLALTVLVLGQVGALTPLGIGLALACGALVGVCEAFRRPSRPLVLWKSSPGTPVRSRREQESAWIAVGFDLALAAGVVGSLLVALKPATDGDALCYHLQVPKVFLAAGAVGFEPDLHETVYPLVTELLYAVALAFRSPVACRLIQWVFGLVFAASVTALARPALGTRARWAGTIALLVPAVSNGMGAPLNDVALAAYGCAALLAWVRWYDRPTIGAALLAGLLAGLTLGVKYPALVWVGLLGLSMLGVTWRERTAGTPSVGTKRLSGKVQGWAKGAGTGRRRSGASPLGPTSALETRTGTSRARSQSPFPGPEPPSRTASKTFAHVAIFGGVALLVGGLWYLRAFGYTGNPVYPFFRDTFGGAGIEDVLAPAKQPMAVTLWNVLTALVPMTLDPNRFDSVSHQFGPVFLMFLPALFFFRPPRRVVGLVAIGWLFLTVCVTQRQSMRFVLIAVGPMAVGVAWLAAEWARRRIVPARLLVGMLLLVLAFESSIALYRTRHGLDVVLGRESTQDYLARVEPTYLVGRWIDEHLPEETRLIGQDHRGFYLPRPYTMELAHRRRTGLASRGESAEEIVATLQERGFTHLMLCPPVPEDAVEFDGRLARALQPWLAGRVPVYRRDLTDGDGVVRAYAIYELVGGEPPATQPALLATDDATDNGRLAR